MSLPVADVMTRIQQRLSPDAILGRIEQIHQHERWFTFPKFHESAECCKALMQQAGLQEVEILQYPADGESTYGDWVPPQGWDATEATLEIIEPSVEQPLLAQYTDTPHTLVMYSAATPPEGLALEVVDVREYEGSLEGKILLGSVRGIDISSLERKVREGGGRGLIAYNEDLPPDVARWRNDSFLPRNEDGLFGFSLSRERGELLRKLVAEGGTVRVRAVVNTRHYDDHLDLITGVIPGQDREREVWALMHIFEPGAWDNASGAACAMEALQRIQELVSEGRLPPPQRTIRLLLSWEIYGFTAYVATNAERLRGVDAAIVLDCAGLPPESETATFQVRLNPDSSPAFTDALAKLMLKELVARQEAPFPSLTGNFGLADNFLADPMIGVPAPFLIHDESPRRLWHTTLDTVQELNGDSLCFASTLCGTYLAFLANAGTAEAKWLVDHVRAEVENELTGKLAADGQARPTARDLLDYYGEKASGALASLRRLAPADERPALDEAIGAATAASLTAMSAACGTDTADTGPPPERSELESPAMQLVPERLVLGSLTLRGLPPEVRHGCRWAPAYSTALNLPLFWADGKRSLLEIHRKLLIETGRSDLEQLLGYFSFLEEHSFIRWVPTQ